MTAPATKAAQDRRWAAGRTVAHLTGENLRTHRARTLLSVLGVACGVALVVAVNSLSSSITASAQAIALAAANKANIEVRPAGPLGLPADAAARVRAAPGVQVAGGAVEALTQVRVGHRQAHVLLLGFEPDLVGLASRKSTGTVRITHAGGIVLPARLLSRLHASPHGQVEVITPTGWRTVDVGGVSEGLDNLDMAAAPLPLVQSLVGKPGRVDVVYAKSSNPKATEAALEQEFGGAVNVGRPAHQRRDLSRLLDTMRMALLASTLVALFVGMFLVYNTMSMAAVQRMGDAAVLRAVGAGRAQLAGLFLLEAAVIGAVGSVVGVPGGYLLAKAVLTLRLADLEQLLPILVTRFVVTPRALAAAGATGVAVAVAAGALPAIRLARLPIAPVLRSQAASAEPGGRRRRWPVGAAVVALAVGAAVVRSARMDPTAVSAGLTIVLAAVAVLIPFVLPALASLLARPFGWGVVRRRDTVAHLAAADVQRTPRRTAFTSGAVLLAVTLVVAIAVGMGSFVSSVRGHISTWLQGDLYVRSATWQPFGSGTPLDPSVAQRLDQVPGVRDAYPYRTFTFATGPSTVVVYAWPFDQLRRDAAHLPADYARLLDIDGADSVGVSRSLLTALHLHVGDTLSMPTPNGLRPVRIALGYSDSAALFPTVYMDWKLFSRYWGAPSADDFAVFLEPGASAQQVMPRIAALGPQLGIEVEDHGHFADRIVGIIGFIQVFMTLIQLTALLMAGLAVANTLFMAGVERRSEFASMRAVGMQAGELQRMVVVQAALLAVVGIAAGCALGTGIGAGIRYLTQAQLTVPIPLRTPGPAYAAAAVGALAVTAVAALFPARRAARQTIAAGLRTD